MNKTILVGSILAVGILVLAAIPVNANMKIMSSIGKNVESKIANIDKKINFSPSDWWFPGYFIFSLGGLLLGFIYWIVLNFHS